MEPVEDKRRKLWRLRFAYGVIGSMACLLAVGAPLVLAIIYGVKAGGWMVGSLLAGLGVMVLTYLTTGQRLMDAEDDLMVDRSWESLPPLIDSLWLGPVCSDEFGPPAMDRHVRFWRRMTARLPEGASQGLIFEDLTQRRLAATVRSYAQMGYGSTEPDVLVGLLAAIDYLGHCGTSRKAKADIEKIASMRNSKRARRAQLSEAASVALTQWDRRIMW